MKKICTKCGIAKELSTDNFSLHKIRKDGFNSQCKECKKMADSERYQVERVSILEDKKRYYKENKEKLTARQIAYYHQNKVKCGEAEKAWRINNPQKRRIINERRRTEERNLTSTLNSSEWDKTKDYFNNSCAYCGISEELHLERHGELLHHEHLIPLKKGGGYDKENIIPACRSCNSSKGNKDFAEWYSKSKVYDKDREVMIVGHRERSNKWNH